MTEDPLAEFRGHWIIDEQAVPGARWIAVRMRARPLTGAELARRMASTVTAPTLAALRERLAQQPRD